MQLSVLKPLKSLWPFRPLNSHPQGLNMKIIAFAGPKTAGKDTAAKALLSRNSVVESSGEDIVKFRTLFQQENFGDSVKSVCSAAFGLTQEEMYDSVLKERVLTRWPFKSPRELMQNVAKVFRTMYGGDIWVQRWLQKLPSIRAQCIVVTDLRHEEELQTLQELGALMIYIQNPEVEETRRLGIQAGDPLWTDASEAFAEQMKRTSHIIIENHHGDLQGLYTRTQDAVAKHFGPWAQW